VSELGIISELRDSSIPGAVAWMRSGRIAVWLGDFEAEVWTMAEAAEWLRTQAIRHYPDSDFAKNHGGRLDA
jgi:hypothetical protein